MHWQFVTFLVAHSLTVAGLLAAALLDH